MNPRIFAVLLACLFVVSPEVRAQEVEPAAEAPKEKVRFSGYGDVTSDAQEIYINGQVRELFGTPAYAVGEIGIGQRQNLYYDMLKLSGKAGAGWALTEHSDLEATYRFRWQDIDNTDVNSDPAYQNVSGRTDTTALGLDFIRDTRDDWFHPTDGSKLRVGGELALEELGGDFDFGRTEFRGAIYRTPFRDSDGFWSKVTFVEHLRLGWVEPFGDSDQVPFFERYFTGGAGTVRGHRGGYLSPRGFRDNQFIGGEAQVVNNVEARMLVMPDFFKGKLAAAAFFDIGRSYRRFSSAGDFGYGFGVGLRYKVELWKVKDTLRLDYGINPAREDDDSQARLHLTFGVPF